MPTLPLSDLERADVILGQYARVGIQAVDFANAFWAGSHAAVRQTHRLSENPFSETAEPLDWAAWVRGYWHGVEVHCPSCGRPM